MTKKEAVSKEWEELHQSLYGQAFLIPLSVLPQAHFSKDLWGRPGHTKTVKALGTVVKIEDELFFKVEKWGT